MSIGIRAKFLGTIVFITLFLSSIFFGVISPLINAKFEEHELKSATRKLKQVEEVFDYQFQGLNNLVHDLARWQDTSLFVDGKGGDTVAANVMRNSFVNSARIDLFLTLNADNISTHGVFLNAKNNTFGDIDSELLQTIMSHTLLLNEEPQKKREMCVVQVGDKFLVLAASPIHDPNSKDMFRGTLIMGRFLDEQQLEQLREMTQFDVDFYPISAGPQDVREAGLALASSSSPYYMKTLSDEIIKGYSIVYDASGQGGLMMVITLDRLLHKKHHDNRSFLFKAIILCSIVFGFVCFLFIEIIISRRLSAIISDVRKIEKSGFNGVRIRASTIKDELGKLSKSINLMLEANENLQEYKIKSKRLESVATFAAGASHELATPISTIALASGEMLRDLAAGESNEEDLYDDIFLIREQVDRCKYIINQIAADTGSHMGEAKISFSSKVLIEETLQYFSKAAVAQIQIENQICDRLLYMPFLSLSRVLRGLLKNGIDASEDGKPIFLSCNENATHLIFVVRDQGKGMDEHTLKHAFDPFFSTKDPGGNLGLGLFLAQALASMFDGDLEIVSSLGRGTTISLSFAKEKIYVR